MPKYKKHLEECIKANSTTILAIFSKYGKIEYNPQNKLIVEGAEKAYFLAIKSPNNELTIVSDYHNSYKLLYRFVYYAYNVAKSCE